MVVAALSLTVLLGFAGLGIDMGMLRYERRLQQSAADAAALAGASDICPGCTGYKAAAQNAAAANGFTSAFDELSDCESSTAAIGTICVDVDSSPDTGPHKNDTNYIQVRIAKVQPTYFMKVFGVNSEVIIARAVAGYLPTGGGCLFAGATAPAVGISIGGSGEIDAPSCPIIDNGGFDTTGNKLIVNASSFSVSSNVPSGSGNTSIPGINCTATPSACPNYGAPAGADPLAYLTPPTVGAPVPFNPAMITPGTYSGIDLGGSCGAGSGGGSSGSGGGGGRGGGGGGGGGGGSTNYTFPSGTYIISGGSFLVGNTTNIQGSGVTFYFTNGATFCASGTPDIQLSAPTTGAYPGILFYQDPNDSAGAWLGGDTSSYYQGALYFPGSQLNFYGNDSFNGAATYTVVDAKSVSLSGNPTVNLQSSPANFPGAANLGKAPVLVE